MAAPDVRQRMLESGSEPITSTPEELTARFADWVERFGKIAAQAGLKPQ
jgi:tripartite-type tricarboxylate transporter receptor subunit TctC